MSVELGLTLDRTAEQQLLRNIRELPDVLLDKVVKAAASTSMTPVLKAARARCPERHGTLKRALGKRRKVYKRSGVVFVAVGPRRGFKDTTTGADPVNYAHLVEGGTAQHEVSSASGKLAIGPVVISGTVDHPGAKAQPFMRPAYDSQRHTVVDKYRRDVLRGAERTIKKMKGAS